MAVYIFFEYSVPVLDCQDFSSSIKSFLSRLLSCISHSQLLKSWLYHSNSNCRFTVYFTKMTIQPFISSAVFLILPGLFMENKCLCFFPATKHCISMTLFLFLPEYDLYTFPTLGYFSNSLKINK